MKKHRRAGDSASLVVMMILSLCCMLQTMAFAVDSTVLIEETQSVATIQSKIQAAIDRAQSGDTVTVTGNKTNADTGMVLEIPAGIKVLWKAKYSAVLTRKGPDSETFVLMLVGEGDGFGTFEVPAGGVLSGTLPQATLTTVSVITSKCDVIVSGGEVLLSGDIKTGINGSVAAITCDRNLTISGGRVGVSGPLSAADTTTIVAVMGSRAGFYVDGVYTKPILCTTITGGEVRGLVVGSGGRITELSGGTIVASAYNYEYARGRETGYLQLCELPETRYDAIESMCGTVIVTGGALVREGDDTRPGTIIPSGSNVSNSNIVILKGIAADFDHSYDGDLYDSYSTVVEVDTLLVPEQRHGTSEGLILKNGYHGSVAVWDMSGDKPQIKISAPSATGPIDLLIPWGTKGETPGPTPTAPPVPTPSPSPTPSAPDESIAVGTGGANDPKVAINPQTGLLTGLRAGNSGGASTTVAAVRKLIQVPHGAPQGSTIKLYAGSAADAVVVEDQEENISNTLATGMEFRLADATGKVLDTVVVVVMGDLAGGDGIADIADIVQLANAVRGKVKLAPAFIAAGNLSGTTAEVDIADIVALANLIRSN